MGSTCCRGGTSARSCATSTSWPATCPASRCPVWVGGAAVTMQYAFGPTIGAGVNVTLISYQDTCALGINADSGAIPDLARLPRVPRRRLRRGAGARPGDTHRPPRPPPSAAHQAPRPAGDTYLLREEHHDRHPHRPGPRAHAAPTSSRRTGCAPSTPSSTAPAAAAEAFRALRPGAGRPHRRGDGASPASGPPLELAALAIEETGFGVFEDKVIKNYVATEFLYDYLRDKRSVGVIDEDAERGIVDVAEPIGVVLAHHCRSPTRRRPRCSRRSSPPRPATRSIFRPSPHATRCARARVEILQRGRRGRRPAARRAPGHPRRRRTRSRTTSSTTRASTSSGPPAARRSSPLANAAGKPGLCVGPGQRAGLRAPQRRHRRCRRRHADLQDLRRLGDLPRRADLHRRRRDLRRDGRRVRPDGRPPARRPTQVDGARRVRVRRRRQVNIAALGQQAPELARRAGIAVAAGDQDPAGRRSRPTSTSSPRTRCCRRS